MKAYGGVSNLTFCQSTPLFRAMGVAKSGDNGFAFLRPHKGGEGGAERGSPLERSQNSQNDPRQEAPLCAPCLCARGRNSAYLRRTISGDTPRFPMTWLRRASLDRWPTCAWWAPTPRVLRLCFLRSWLPRKRCQEVSRSINSAEPRVASLDSPLQRPETPKATGDERLAQIACRHLHGPL
jgi:hypothetical protein